MDKIIQDLLHKRNEIRKELKELEKHELTESTNSTEFFKKEEAMRTLYKKMMNEFYGYFSTKESSELHNSSINSVDSVKDWNSSIKEKQPTRND